MNARRYIVVLAIVLWCAPAVAAREGIDTVSSLPGIEITTAVDRAEAYVGDLITYTLTIAYDSTYELVPPPLGANLGAFDVKDYETDRISRIDGGRLKSENTFKLSTFTTGQYMIPPLPIQFQLPDGERKVLMSEAVPIKIESLLAEGADSSAFRPLKAQYEFERDITRYYVWGGIGLALLLLSAGLIWWQIRKRRDHGDEIDLRPPWEIAFEKLAHLQQKSYVADKEYRQYYFELTEITRDFLGRMYGVNVLDMTTTEFRERFDEMPMPEGVFDRAMTLFNHADLVKFARLEPKEGRPSADLEEAHAIIETVRAEYVRRQEEEKRRQQQKRSEKVEAAR